MLKKFVTLLLMSLGLTLTVRAFEPVQLYAIVSDDQEAQITVENKSGNVRVGKLTKRGGKVKGMRRFFAITFEDGRADVEIKVKISGNGKFQLNAAGFAESAAGQKPEYSWIDCTSLEVNGQTLIPMGKRKMYTFSTWRALVRPTEFSGEQTYEIKATFTKPSADRVAKLEAAARRRAERQKATQDK